MNEKYTELIDNINSIARNMSKAM